ncbi:MAG: S-methyl-5-thioribose-1-phosphate isomerase [Armatimonadota bacterium]|nr:S-methyl-5-thioribose-1-phosphate isomerase [Armatimonadota bacterium]MDR5703789.1 S-methyl-5-thioribose-1-phosphate isomerase [Armatimonadota bacterium]
MRTIWWEKERVKLLDQTKLPHRVEVVECTRWEEVAEAIRTLKIRGAPAIGVAGAFALALAARTLPSRTREEFLEALTHISRQIQQTRPTAVNLSWALHRLLQFARNYPGNFQELPSLLLEEAGRIAQEDIETNRAIARHGSSLIQPGERILTYCNTGSLATVDYGTALGIIRAAHEQGKGVHVYVCETRPVLQGARLTAWEVLQYGIPATLITDNAAGFLMRKGQVDRVLVGADRIARNGDVANKIGTYTLAILARFHGIPFIVAAPLSSVDFEAPDGWAIPIEERPPEEVTHIGGLRIAPEGIQVANPAFDVTPADLVTAIVTERGIATPPFKESLEGLRSRAMVS